MLATHTHGMDKRRVSGLPYFTVHGYKSRILFLQFRPDYYQARASKISFKKYMQTHGQREDEFLRSVYISVSELKRTEKAT